MSAKNTSRTPLIVAGLLFAALVVCIVSLYGARGAEFAGADDQAEEQISEVAPDYKPWFEPIFEPGSSEIESGLFASQAAIGGLIVGYALGVLRTRSNQRRQASPAQPTTTESAAPAAAENRADTRANRADTRTNPSP